MLCSGATSIRQWLPGQSLFDQVKRTIEGLREKRLKIDWVVWHQGESETVHPARDGQQYKTDLSKVINGLRTAGVSAPVLICLASRHDGLPAEDIRVAQQAVWADDDGVFAGVDTDSMGAEYRSDGVHFNDRGLERFAVGLVQAMKKRSSIRAVTVQDLAP